MLISCLLTKSHTSCSHDSFVIPIKLRPKQNFRKTPSCYITFFHFVTMLEAAQAQDCDVVSCSWKSRFVLRHV